MNGAQNQHYVPKFLLRKFLSNAQSEQVSVYDKHSDKGFTTSIANIMAERRFNDFVIDEWRGTFEETAGRIEDQIIPVYEQILIEQKIPSEPTSRASLAFLIAFQLLRTRSSREWFTDMDSAIREKVEALGGKMENLEGWESVTDDSLTLQHWASIRELLPDISKLIAVKDLVLCKAAPGRAFYLGDTPVAMANQNNFKPYGNIGVGVEGIEIYMPLSSSLMLAAWCPSILDGLRKNQTESKRQVRMIALQAVAARKITADQMAKMLEELRVSESAADEFLAKTESGLPLVSTPENMDYFNSLQTKFARRFVVCQRSDFALARRHNSEFPKFRQGARPVFN